MIQASAAVSTNRWYIIVSPGYPATVDRYSGTGYKAGGCGQGLEEGSGTTGTLGALAFGVGMADGHALLSTIVAQSCPRVEQLRPADDRFGTLAETVQTYEQTPPLARQRRVIRTMTRQRLRSWVVNPFAKLRET